MPEAGILFIIGNRKPGIQASWQDSAACLLMLRDGGPFGKRRGIADLGKPYGKDLCLDVQLCRQPSIRCSTILQGFIFSDRFHMKSFESD